jgi:DNA-binding GntR family transcriptional regulator
MTSAGEADTKSGAIAHEIRRRILDGSYERGRRLRQEDLATEFSVSVTPVREALRTLESESLLVAEAHKGMRVAGIDLDRLEGIYISRRLLEEFATKRAALRLSRRDIAELRALVAEMSAAPAGADLRELNRRFHFAIYESAGLPGLVAQITALWNAFPWDNQLRSPAAASRPDESHQQIVDALAAGDAERAGAAMAEHIAWAVAELREQITAGVGTDPFTEDDGL